nr:hypothetical protein [uncultured Flavobacterium sp.]
MAHFPTKDGSGSDVKTYAAGTGSSSDPYVHASRRKPCPGSTAHTATNSANTAVTITLAAAGANVFNAFSDIYFSLTNVPASPVALTVSDGANVIWNQDITTSGLGVIPISKCNAAANTAMTITLAAAGAGIIGKLSLGDAWTFINS